MEKAELIESIKTNTRYIIDKLNRMQEVLITKTAAPMATPGLEEQTIQDLEMCNLTLRHMKFIVESLERGSKRLGETKEVVCAILTT